MENSSGEEENRGTAPKKPKFRAEKWKRKKNTKQTNTQVGTVERKRGSFIPFILSSFISYFFQWAKVLLQAHLFQINQCIERPRDRLSVSRLVCSSRCRSVRSPLHPSLLFVISAVYLSISSFLRSSLDAMASVSCLFVCLLIRPSICPFIFPSVHHLTLHSPLWQSALRKCLPR